MITAKEALRMAKPAEVEAQEALIEIEKIIKENAEKGSTSVIIRKAPYSNYLMYSSDDPVSKIVVETLRKMGLRLIYITMKGNLLITACGLSGAKFNKS